MSITEPSYVILAVLILHWIGDFLFQTDWMATKKSSSLSALTVHVVTYHVILGLGAIALFGWGLATALFVGVNFIVHFVTDALTSKISSRFYASGNMRGFFVTVGFDQMCHHAALILTFEWIIRGGYGVSYVQSLLAS